MEIPVITEEGGSASKCRPQALPGPRSEYVFVKNFAVLAMLLGVLSPSLTLPQSYPDKPVRLIVPFPPGGANDVIARLLGAKLTESMGKSFDQGIEHYGRLKSSTTAVAENLRACAASLE